MVPENPEGVSWTNNPSFPLKASVSEPEGEAWEAMSPLYHTTPKGLHIHNNLWIPKCNPFGVGGELYFFAQPSPRRYTSHTSEEKVGLIGHGWMLQNGDLLRCFRNSGSVTYVSTLPSPSPSAPGISSCVQSPSTFKANVREWHFVQHSHIIPFCYLCEKVGS